MADKVAFGSLDNLPEIPGYAPGLSKRVIFGPTHCAPEEQFVIRYFSMGPTLGPRDTHVHPWCHWIIVHRGTATLVADGEMHELSAGSWLYMPSNVPHTIYNADPKETLIFFCTVRPEGDTNPPAPEANQLGCG